MTPEEVRRVLDLVRRRITLPPDLLLAVAYEEVAGRGMFYFRAKLKRRRKGGAAVYYHRERALSNVVFKVYSLDYAERLVLDEVRELLSKLVLSALGEEVLVDGRRSRVFPVEE